MLQIGQYVGVHRGRPDKGEDFPEGFDAQPSERRMSFVFRERFWNLCQRGFIALFIAVGFLLLSTIHSLRPIVWVLRGAGFVSIGVAFMLMGYAARAFWRHMQRSTAVRALPASR